MKKSFSLLGRAALVLPFAVLAACEHPSAPQVVPQPKPVDQMDATAARLGVPPAELASARATLDGLVAAWSGPAGSTLQAPAVELTRALRTLTVIEAAPVPVDAFRDLSTRARRLEAEQAAGSREQAKP